MPDYANILIVDDHSMVRAGAALFLQAVDSSIVVRHAKTTGEARQLIQIDRPDLVFLDMFIESTDKPDGLDLLHWLKDQNELAHIPVLIMSGEVLNRAQVEDLLAQGAAGFIAKGATEGPEVFRTALMNLRLNAPFIYGARSNIDAASLPPPRPLGDDAFTGLNATHRQVLIGVIKGKPYKIIAKELGLAEQTVRSNVRDLNRKFGVKNSRQLVYEIACAGVAINDV